MNTVMELLTRFGFSKNEARVYLALVQEDAATGYQISKNTGISRAEVYRVLGNLPDTGSNDRGGQADVKFRFKTG